MSGAGQRENEFDITFFVPCLNEEANVVDTIETILEAVRQVGCTYEILVVDDHSGDATAAKVEEYAKAHPDVPLQLVRNARTMGLARNYVDAAFLGRGKYYKIVTGDNSEPLESMVAVLKRLNEADIIIPYLRSDTRTFFRRNLSILYTKLINLLSGYRLRYYNGTSAHLRYNIMRWHSDTYGFAYNAEVITRLLSEGATYIEVPVDNIEREGRVSKAFSAHNILSVLHSMLQIFLRRVRRWMFSV